MKISKKSKGLKKASGSSASPVADQVEQTAVTTPVTSPEPPQQRTRTKTTALSRKRKVRGVPEPELEEVEIGYEEKEEKIEGEEREQVSVETEGKEKEEEEVEESEEEDVDNETPIITCFGKKRKTVFSKSPPPHAPIVGSSSLKKKNKAPLGTPAEKITPKRFSASAKKSQTPQPTHEEKLAYFRKCKILPNKFVDIPLFLEYNCGQFTEKLKVQGWESLFSKVELCCDRTVREFYVNYTVKAGTVLSSVDRIEIKFDVVLLGEFLGVPADGFDVYIDGKWENFGEDMSTLGICRKFYRDYELDKERTVMTYEMTGYHKMLFIFAQRCMIPKAEGGNEANCRDLVMMELLDIETTINLPSLMIQHIGRVVGSVKTQLHSLPYWFILSKIMDYFNVAMDDDRIPKVTDYLGTQQLEACGFKLKRSEEKGKGVETEGEQTPGTGPGARGSKAAQPGPSSSAEAGPPWKNRVPTNSELMMEVQKLIESQCIMMEAYGETISPYQDIEVEYKRNEDHVHAIDAALARMFELMKDSMEEIVVEEDVPAPASHDPAADPPARP